MRGLVLRFLAVLMVGIIGFSSCGGGGGPARDLTPPGPPELLQIIEGDGRLVLKFRKPSDPDVVRYRIYRNTSPITDIANCNCAVDVIPATGDPMEYRSRSLTNGIPYYYRVTAIDGANNESPPSNELSGTPREILISQTASFPRRVVSAFDGSRFLVVWDTDKNNDPFSPNHDIEGIFVHPDGYRDGLPLVIANDSNVQEQNPDLAYDPTSGYYVVVWDHDNPKGIRLNRIAPDGTVLNPPIDIPVFPESIVGPRVACSTDGCLIVWYAYSAQSGSIKYVRLRNGGLVDASPQSLYEIPSGDIPIRVSVTASSSLFLVTWSSAVEKDPFAMRVDWSLPVDSQPLRLTYASGDQRRPIAAPLSPGDPNSSFLVVWEDFGSGSPSQNDIVGVVVPPSGPPSGEIGISVGSSGRKELTAISTSADGLKGLIAWADYRDPDAAPRIYYLRLKLDPAIEPVGGEVPASDSVIQSNPYISFGLSRFLITWLDYRRTTNIDNPITDIYGHALDE